MPCSCSAAHVAVHVAARVAACIAACIAACVVACFAASSSSLAVVGAGSAREIDFFRFYFSS